ncbi:putative cytochrome P450 [Aspergillus ambiguus]|uniref:putative cytochrome P450 n=1 Tax=Aspergillus ambiguus TaxID=176160 RepID=UPI003CCD3679
MPSPIPQPKGYPLVGNLFDIDSQNPWGSFNKLALENNYRPIFKINLLGKELVFITGAALLEEVCDDKRFRKCVSGPIVEIRDAVHSSLFTATESEMEDWGIAHRIMAPLVSTEAVAEVYSGMKETMPFLIKKWTAGPRQRVNVTNDLDRLNHAANMLCFFGQNIDCVNGPEPPAIHAHEASTIEATRRASRPRPLTWLFHQRKYDNYIKTMREYGAGIVAHRRAYPTDRHDMLDALLNGKDPQTGKGLTESQVLDEIVNCFIGCATAPNLISFALYYLMKNPDTIRQAREEIDSVVGSSESVEQEHLARLPYCKAIVDESFRLSAVAPGFNREPQAGEGPVLLAGGEYEISRKQQLIVILSAVGRDPAVFEDPEAFKPERMLGEKFDRLPAGVKKRFGNGKRECIGKRFAYEWCFTTLVSILKDVEFELADANYKMYNDGTNYNGAFSVKPQEFFAMTGPRQRSG